MRFVYCLPLICLLGIPFVESEVYKFTNYKVWEVTPENESHRSMLHSLQENLSLDFWETITVGHKTRISVSPNYQSEFQQVLSANNIPASIIIEDLEEVFENERRVRLIHDERYKKMKNAGVKSRHTVDFEHFWSHEEVNDYLEELEEEDIGVERFLVANTSLGLESWGIKYSYNSTLDGDKPIVFFDCGVHAREWIAVMQCMYIVHELCSHPYKYLDILDEVDFVIIPIVNPDGYEHSRNGYRLWRKTRSANEGSGCIGTDGNRNYGFQWQNGTRNPCSDTFSGAGPFSEPEIAGVRDALHEHRLKTKLYISVHSYGNYLLYPWGFDNILISNWEDHENIGQEFAQAIYNASGTRYTVGNSAIALYPAAGASDDFAASVGIPLSYTLELPGGGNYGFDIPAERIQDVVQETMHGLLVLIEHIADIYGDSSEED